MKITYVLTVGIIEFDLQLMSSPLWASKRPMKRECSGRFGWNLIVLFVGLHVKDELQVVRLMASFLLWVCH